MMRDFSIDHIDPFEKEPKLPSAIFKKAQIFMDRKERGPFYNTGWQVIICIEGLKPLKSY